MGFPQNRTRRQVTCGRSQGGNVPKYYLEPQRHRVRHIQTLLPHPRTQWAAFMPGTASSGTIILCGVSLHEESNSSYIGTPGRTSSHESCWDTP